VLIVEDVLINVNIVKLDVLGDDMPGFIDADVM